MQGIESLDNFKKFVSSIGGLGRYEDTYIVHAAEGETVVPMEVLDKNPALKKRLFKTMMDMGIEPGRYIVGNELNSKNPVTGQPEFFLKQIGRRLRKRRQIYLAMRHLLLVLCLVLQQERLQELYLVNIKEKIRAIQHKGCKWHYVVV